MLQCRTQRREAASHSASKGAALGLRLQQTMKQGAGVRTLTSPQLKPGRALVRQKKHKALRQAMQGAFWPAGAPSTTIRALHLE